MPALPRSEAFHSASSPESIAMETVGSARRPTTPTAIRFDSTSNASHSEARPRASKTSSAARKSAAPLTKNARRAPAARYRPVSLSERKSSSSHNSSPISCRCGETLTASQENSGMAAISAHPTAVFPAPRPLPAITSTANPSFPPNQENGCPIFAVLWQRWKSTNKTSVSPSFAAPASKA